jgi:hypothetical protein
MAKKPNPKIDDPEESKRFIDVAREVEADKSKDALERAFNKVVSPKRINRTKRPKLSDLSSH